MNDVTSVLEDISSVEIVSGDEPAALRIMKTMASRVLELARAHDKMIQEVLKREYLHISGCRCDMCAAINKVAEMHHAEKVTRRG
jgi:hypothetical protein